MQKIRCQFMRAASLIAYMRTKRFYLCHHISLSGGEAVLMTQRLLALCFGSPVNTRHADGISPLPPLLSLQ